ncbi:MAG: LD-carboxypeptidase [Balneolia bacterium]|nr:LD-carboxypeptidase [Balneolia bacterium]
MSSNQTKPDSLIPLKPLPAKGIIGIFAPSSPVDSVKLERGIRYLESLGYRTKTTKSCYASLNYIAGTGEERAHDLMSLVNDPQVDAIFSTRGGFGSIMMLPWLNYEEIGKARKIILGFSDVTALQWAIYRKSGLPTISAGMVGTDLAKTPLVPQFEEHFWKLLHSGEVDLPLDYQTDQPREVHGISMPGTISVAAMLLGSGYFPDLNGTIPIFEDVNEQQHKVEAYLQQMKLGGHLNQLSGVVLGRFTPAEKEEYPDRPSRDLVFDRAFGRGNYPVVKGFDYGHVPEKISLPTGVPISLSLGDQSVMRTRKTIFEH